MFSHFDYTGGHRVTQHFFDALGRETNTTTRIASVPGDAVEPDFVSPAGSWCSVETTEYPCGTSDYSIHTDARGVRTVTRRKQYTDRVETTTETNSPTNHEACVTRTITAQYRNGGSFSEAQWDGLWTRSTHSTTYDEDGTRIETSITESIGDELVTNRVVRFDFLERVVSEETPKGTNSTEYVGSTSRVASSTFQNEETQQIVTYGYDIHGDLSSTTQNGVTLQDVTTYETIDNEIWKVETQARTSEASTRVASSRTQLTGLSNALRGHTVSTNFNGEVTVSQSSWDQARRTTTDTTTSNLRSNSSQTRQFGLVISSHTPDEERRFYFDPYGRSYFAERKGKATSIWRPVEKSFATPEAKCFKTRFF